MTIGGNIKATVQIKTVTGKNAIGEGTETWTDVGQVLGWLDYASGQNDVNQYNAKLQDTTHFFLCDHSRWIKAVQGQQITAENCRLQIRNNTYNVLLIDNPMELDQHLEIYLQYIGGGLGV